MESTYCHQNKLQVLNGYYIAYYLIGTGFLPYLYLNPVGNQKTLTDDEKLDALAIEKNLNRQLDARYRQIWQSLVNNYEMVEGAHLSNSFIILLALIEAGKPLSSADISKVIALHSKGQLYKIASTLKDSLEKRLKREGFVESTELANRSRHTISSKGRKLLKGWISFISTYST